jgi:hypothetical protein
MALKIEGSPSNLSISLVSVSTTASEVVAARPGRRLLSVQLVTGSVYVGDDSSVTPLTGFLLNYLPNPLETAAALWAVTASGSATLAVTETYDQE